MIGLTIMLAYQVAITHYDLAQYIFFAPRTEIISANREGIFSIFGYFSLQIIGIGLGRLLFTEMLAPEHLKHLEAGKPLKDLKVSPV